ncbi:hypothetical protein BUALT_Bualt07G0065800 [Buddleja alternifolia]|uniref:Exonuclease domain-containing protein n=1 Tax=Buddleja alternifolia TaxID=168488 RepID=A0AAV6XGH1_9LAMI|nr:hypothetical protein BUALT_Bualt07G0065800 [Buddleja alternifolia]
MMVPSVVIDQDSVLRRGDDGADPVPAGFCHFWNSEPFWYVQGSSWSSEATHMVRPADLSHISSLSVRCNGITKEAVDTAPTFADIADIVYDLLHGRIWAGHNILRFDCARIREAFAEINRPVPEPRGTIDSLALLRQKFGRRAGDMKHMFLVGLKKLINPTLTYIWSLADVRMNIEVLKYCAIVLFWSPAFQTYLQRTVGSLQMPPQEVEVVNHIMEENHPILSLMTPYTSEQTLPIIEFNPAKTNPFNLVAVGEEIENEPLPEDNMEEEKTDSLTSVGFEDPHGYNDFVEADDISIPSIFVTLAPFFRGTQKIHILHQNLPLQLRCRSLKVRFGISTKYVDHAGRPRLSFVVDPSQSLCRILDMTDSLAQKLSVESGSSSEWRPVLNRKPGFFNFPTIRLQLPTIADGEITRWATEIYQKDGSATQRLVFSRFDVVELDSLFTPGSLVDAYFSLDTYDYQQNAGIRLVAKKLIIHSS